ncbi:MAG: hypothetical protein M3296_03045, partial [Actinomycetota bacterium]|nr:hypothetical protein [Actinomycetota bacterium]
RAPGRRRKRHAAAAPRQRRPRRRLSSPHARSDLEPFTDTALCSLGAYFADRHPDLMDDVVDQAQRSEDAGVGRYAEDEGVGLEGALQTLVTGLAVRYCRAVAGAA